MKISRVQVWVVELPQIPPVAPYRSRIRTSSTTRSGIVRLETNDGLDGWGEYNVNFLPDRTAEREREAALHWVEGRSLPDLNSAATPVDAMASYFHNCPIEIRLRSGVEMAMWDLVGKRSGQPVWRLLGDPIRTEIELAACMGIASYDRAGELATHYAELGYTTLKMKAGADMDEDCEMVRGVRDAIGDRMRLRVDPNCAYSPEEAFELARRLETYRLEYLEQPMAADRIDDAARLRSQTSTPIALNESVGEPDSVPPILAANAAAVLLPDTPQAGGVGPCVQIGRLAEAAGVPCVMHCGHDLGLKTAAMLHVAAACPAYSLANDSTYDGLAADILSEPLPIVRGKMHLPTQPGWGVQVDADMLIRYRAC